MNNEIKKRFLKDTDETGRFIVKSLVTGISYYVEPIDDSGIPADWGDLDPVTKKLTGNYGVKHKGSIKEKESMITSENGFLNITKLNPGESPIDYICRIDKERENARMV